MLEGRYFGDLKICFHLSVILIRKFRTAKSGFWKRARQTNSGRFWWCIFWEGDFILFFFLNILAKFSNSRVKDPRSSENFRLHILYLINDWAYHWWVFLLLSFLFIIMTNIINMHACPSFDVKWSRSYEHLKHVYTIIWRIFYPNIGNYYMTICYS